MPRGRASDYSVEEVLHFLNLMEEILPIGSQEWDQLLQLHLVDFPTTGRTVDSLRRKYASLHRKKIPTGDPECPVEVKKAKRVKRLIGIKADLGCGEEEMDITDGALIGPNDSEEPTSNNESTETEGDVESDDVPLNENTNVPFVTPAASVTPLVAPPAADAVAIGTDTPPATAPPPLAVGANIPPPIIILLEPNTSSPFDDDMPLEDRLEQIQQAHELLMVDTCGIEQSLIISRI